MIWDISPYVGVGPLRLGMTQDAVRTAIGAPFDSYMKAPSSEMPTDAFDQLGVHVFYKKPGVCNAIELAPPAEPTLFRRRVLGRPFREVRLLLERVDKQLSIEDEGATSFMLGVGVYAPGRHESDDTPVVGVIVFEKGYYD